jgi:transcriptional regulator with XRE-family HTH domain
MAMRINVVALRTLRELAGLSQAELSRQSGIRQGHISNIESGQKTPRPETVRRFAAVMGVPVAAPVSRADRTTDRSTSDDSN